MRERVRTVPNLSDASPAHQAALESREDHYRSWSQNVSDDLKGKTDEEIREHLQRTAHPFAVCFEHWIGDFNMGSGIRNANAFNAREVYYVGDRKWDRRASVGVYNYTPVNWLPTIEEFKRLQNDYIIVGIDNVPGSVPISSYRWQPNTLMVFGEEGTGLTPGMLELCQDVVAIEMYGSVRSLNCGVASGIVMFDYVNQIKRNHSYFREKYDV